MYQNEQIGEISGKNEENMEKIESLSQVEPMEKNRKISSFSSSFNNNNQPTKVNYRIILLLTIFLVIGDDDITQVH